MFKPKAFLKIVGIVFAAVAFGLTASAREFALNGVTLDLQEVTTNVDVYFTSMRLNRAVNEWNVNVTVSNKVNQTFSGPLVLLVDSYTGTSGPLRVDGVSANQFFLDLSGQLHQGNLAPYSQSEPRLMAMGYTAGDSPKLVTQVYALGAETRSAALRFTRSLNEAGQPLPGVVIQETGPEGNTTNATEGDFGVVTLGKSTGDYVWKFSFPGYLPVWRRALLSSNNVAVIPYPRLARRTDSSRIISPLTGGIVSNQTVQVQISGGNVPQDTTAQLTVLDGQSLPFFLPQGWSPLQAFSLELGADVSQAAPTALIPWGSINQNETAALVKFNSTTLTWQVLQLVTGNGTNAVSVSLPGSGTFALAVPDAAPGSPPAATIGTALQPSLATNPDPANLTAGGVVNPVVSPASIVPELVTATADVSVTNSAGALASGTLLHGEVSEHYLLRDGTTRMPPAFDNFIVGYQRPGNGQTNVLHAHFPLRPLLLFGAEKLDSGTVHVDLFSPGLFTGGILDTNGGLIADGSVRLLAGPGMMQERSAIQLQSLSPTNFTDLTGTNFTVVAAFQAAVSGVRPGGQLSFQAGSLPPNQEFVLGKVIDQVGWYGVEPRERLHSDASGNLSSDEPASGARLPGLMGAGQYLLLQVQPQQGLVAGVAKNSSGQATGGLPVSIIGQPWLTFSAADGSFKLLAPAGPGQLSLSDPARGDVGTQSITIPANLDAVNTEISSAASDLLVTSITPTNNAVNVPFVTSVVINFNRAINPATLMGDAVQLLDASNQPVAATISLNLANTTVTLLPGASLDPTTHFHVLLSTNIMDTIGRSLDGQNKFSFTTVALSDRDPAAQLIIYQPDATNLTADIVAALPGYVPGTNAHNIVVHGTPGCADPEVPVIVANENSGETTTVLSKADGSFTTFVSGEEQDFISATFVSLNSSRIYVPVNRQLFDDGSVGLYPQGGVLQAQGDGGPVQVVVPPNAIGTRAKFTLGSVNVAEVEAQLQGQIPDKGTIAGSGLNLRIEGQLPTLPLQVRFPVDLAQLGYPTNEAPTNAAAVLVVAQTNNDMVTFEVKDQLLFKPDVVENKSFKGLKTPNGDGGVEGQLTAGILDTSVGFIAALPGGQVAQNVFFQLVVPILLGPRPVVIKGKCASIPLEIAIGLQQAGALSAAVNLQTGNEYVDVPVQLGQQMNLIKGATGNAIGKIQGLGQIVQIGVKALQLWVAANGKALSGAFVTATLSGGPLVQQPGRLNPGMVYATSGADGSFLLVAPAVGAQYLVTATHPLFQDIQQEPVNPISLNPLSPQGDLSLAGAVFKNFFFTTPLISQTVPSVSVGAEPIQPAAGQPCQIQINASLPTSQPDIHASLILPVGSTNLLTGLLETNVIGTLSEPVVTHPSGNSTRWTATLTVNKPVSAQIKILIPGISLAVDFRTTLDIGFTGYKAPTPGVIPPPGTNDVHGPIVIETDPLENGYVNTSSEIRIDFNKPIDASVTTNLSGIVLSGSGTAPTPVVILAPDQRTLILRYPGLTAGSTYTLSLSGQSIRDLGGQPLDQRPSTSVPDSFTLNFRTAPVASYNLPGLVNGQGAVISGTRLYILDQTPQDNYLKIYDISKPSSPQFISQKHLFGVPRDLVLIPQYSYARSIHSKIETNDLVVVVGGDLDSQINDVQGTTVSVRGQYLWVINVGNETDPEVLASPIVSYRVGSAVTTVKWAPPFLVYQEFGADIQLLGLVNLQELIIGYNSSVAERADFPTPQRRNNVNIGVDNNGDGDYADPGESLPIPDLAPVEFYGKHQSYVLQGTSQKILDFSVASGGGTLGITLKNGLKLNDQNQSTGQSLPPAYRTLVLNGFPLNISDPTSGMYQFAPGDYPRWVKIFNALPTRLNGVPTILPLALVSIQPGSNGLERLDVIDISLPETPKLLNHIFIPDSLLGGVIQSVRLNANGMLEVAGAQNLVELDPGEILVTNVPPGTLHPSIIGIVADAGAGTRSIGTTDFGVYAVADGGRGKVVQSPPVLNFVSFPQGTALVDPTVLHKYNDNIVNTELTGMRLTGNLAPARVHTEPTLALTSDLEPIPNPALHYYVMVTAPGSAGSEIELGLESLNYSGFPLSNLGQGFAPVRAISDMAQDSIGQAPRPSCGAPIHSLPAYRLSDDPHSYYYNRYLSQPFVLVTETMTLDDLTRIKTVAKREIIFSGAELRAFLDPNVVNAPDAAPVIGSFAATIDARRKMIFPISSVTAFTVNRDYVVGDNPPPPGGSTPMEDTYGTIQSHSGELRTSDIDMSLPSPHMPINIIRSIGNQDNYEGPFGVGWDFNYNQRLTILDPLSFPQGLQMPLVVRDNKEDSEIAGSQDILFNDGQGQVFHFRWADTNMPPGFIGDPLVQEFDYEHLVSDYYLPQHGMFNLLVKFKDGRFERLTPDGMRFRYSPEGRLESIIDRYSDNRHDLQYDANGWLVRIDDHSVSSPRYLEFGHYRRQNADPNFVSGLDMDTGNSYLEGKICRLRDYTGRTVDFQYDDDGFLMARLGVEVSGENNGYSGRNHTFYTYTDCKLVGVKAKENGAPLISAITAAGNNGKPVVQSTTGSHGNDQFSVPVDNSAKTVGNQVAGVTMGDGSSITRRFDKMGNVISATVIGPNGAPATEVRSNTVDGLLFYLLHPEGNSEHMSYNSDNTLVRSRGNLISQTMDPGARGGKGYTKSYHYDPRYNLPSGDQINENSFHLNYALSSDGRSVDSIDYGGAGTKLASYNTHGQLLQTVDQNGVETAFTYDSGSGFLATKKYGEIEYKYGYDGSISSQLGTPSSVTPPRGLPTLLTYDDQCQPLTVSRGDLVTKTGYDELGRSVYHEEQVGAEKKWSTTRVYDDQGFITTSVKNGIEVNGVDSSLTTLFTPDKRSRVETVTYPTGATQTYKYDDRGNVVKMTLGEYTEDYTYDLNNNLTSVKQGGEVVQTYAYDGLDRRTTTVSKTGTEDYTDSTEFYPGGEIKSRLMTDPQFGVLRNVTYDDIDAFGRHLTVETHGTAISPAYTYTYGSLASEVSGPRMTSASTWDTAGNPKDYTDPNSKVVMLRDGNGNTKQTDEQEIGATYSQTYTYDDQDHQTSISDLVGTKFTSVPRADGNSLSVTDARGNKTTLEHTSLGELQHKQRADGMEVVYRHDAQRQLLYEGDPGGGFNYSYDDTFRMTQSSLRSGAAIDFKQFDARSMPAEITMPGGSQMLKYDFQRRLTQRKMTYQSSSWEEDYVYDALNQIRSETYVQNGGANNTATFDYDPAGPLMAAHYHEDGADFTVSYGYYEDGGRKSITYPSGVTVNEIRDATGRLTGLSDADGNIISADSWQGNNQPAVVQLGSTMQTVNQYDQRGRLTASRVTRRNDGSVLAHMRYQYDKANNIQIREFVHRGEKADVFGFDAGERVAQAQIGMLLTNVAGFGPDLYQRQYAYHASGLDYLVNAPAVVVGSNVPPFAVNWENHDNFLLPGLVDGFSRGLADPKGNVAQAQLWVRSAGESSPHPVSATVEHDGLGRLIRITRADGVTIENQYQPDSLRFSRKVSQSGLVLQNSAYVYDVSGRLLEEYDRTGSQPELVARYYYASGDSPVAVDLRNSPGGQLLRYYYLRDGAMSVIAIADASGSVVERVWYDTFGQPYIEARDAAPPVVNRVQSGAGGSIVIALSEPVQPAWNDPGAGAGIIVNSNTLSGALSLYDNDGGAAVPGSVSLEADQPGFKPYSVLRFTPSQTVTGSVTLTFTADVVSDEWGNGNVSRSFTLTNAPLVGTVYYLAPVQSDTSPSELARSSIGSPILFHGQYFDYDAGLIYLRARFYDPFSGMFFEPDPLGYEDSVNHYAGMGNNPVSFRDPSGLRIKGATEHTLHSYLHERGYSSAELHLLSEVHPQLTKLGMGDLEIAAHVRVMYKEYVKYGHSWELGIRKFNDPETRIARVDEFHQGKAEAVVKKSDKNALVEHEGKTYTSDLDGLYAKRDGQIADIEALKNFQGQVNNELARIEGGWRDIAASGGQAIHGKETQKVYQHGFSLNIPQEYGGAHELSEGGTFGIKAVDKIEEKMTKGIGEAFSFSLGKDGFDVHNSVNVDGALAEHSAWYFDHLFNPESQHYNESLHQQRLQQFDKDGAVPATMFPKPFYIENGVH